LKINLGEQILKKLEKITGVMRYNFLGFTLNLQDSDLTDNLKKSPEDVNTGIIQILSTLLTHYSEINSTSLSGKLVKFKDLPGGYAYEGAFIKRGIQPIESVFGENTDDLFKAAELLGGVKLEYGDAGVEIPALKTIPLTYILYGAEDYPGSANILYDKSASIYLPTEDLAVLGEITTMRLIEAKKIVSKTS
jgi:hypothetical protein